LSDPEVVVVKRSSIWFSAINSRKYLLKAKRIIYDVQH
jgi:hypothetical protein